jgi:O-antigen biosynthesis protein WbqV
MWRKVRGSLRPNVAFAHDIVMAALSFPLAVYLRLGDNISFYPTEFILEGTFLFAVVATVVFRFMRLYRGVWRYASLNDFAAIARAVTLAILIFLPLMFFVTRLEALPRSALVINWLLLLALLGGPRALYRIFKDRRLDALISTSRDRRIPVLLIGAGDEAELFIRAISRDPTANYRAVAVIDDKGSRVGRQIHGIEIMGDLDAVETVVAVLSRQGDTPQRIILTKDQLDGNIVRDLFETAEKLNISLSRLPRLTDFRSGMSDRIEVQPIAIEDLLGRPQAVLDRAAMRNLIAGRRVMVTGAGGTIGSELVRQVADFDPAQVTLLDNSEYQLYRIELELTRNHPALPHSTRLADVRDRDALASVLGQEGPEIVFHAAALKHVPLAETNPDEAVLTNTLGTRNLADACAAAGVAAMVMISTDKAVNPTNVMGATKRLAESYCQVLDRAGCIAPEGGTRFITVRFGNVLGSTGSVVPLFQEQLARGGPLTVTHPDMKRYFMSTREAVELVLQASALGVEESAAGAAQAGTIFVLDMGEPVAIVDLARQMIRLAGQKPDEDIAIEFVGLRPGEKLFEELFHPNEPLMPTACKGILLAAPRTTDAALLARALDQLRDLATARRTEESLALLQRLVPEYHRDSTPQQRATATD